MTHINEFVMLTPQMPTRILTSRSNVGEYLRLSTWNPSDTSEDISVLFRPITYENRILYVSLKCGAYDTGAAMASLHLND